MSSAQAIPHKPLATKLAEATAAISYIPKAGYNEAQRYNYVTDADVLDTIRSKLSAVGVATTVGIHSVAHVPFTTSKGAPQFLTTVQGDLTFLDGDTGEAINVPFAGVGADSMDKGYYKAVTGGVKYALLKSFLVPTGDDPERDDEKSGQERPKPPTPAPVQQKATVPQVAEKGTDAEHLTDKQIALLKVTLREAGLSVTDSQRYVLNKLVGKHSSKQMTSADLDTVLAFFKPKTDATEALVVEAMASATGGK